MHESSQFHYGSCEMMQCCFEQCTFETTVACCDLLLCCHFLSPVTMSPNCHQLSCSLVTTSWIKCLFQRGYCHLFDKEYLIWKGGKGVNYMTISFPRYCQSFRQHSSLVSFLCSFWPVSALGNGWISEHLHRAQGSVGSECVRTCICSSISHLLGSTILRLVAISAGLQLSVCYVLLLF